MKDRYKFRIYDEKRQFMISEKCDRAKCEELYGFDEYYICMEYCIPTILNNFFDNYISINNNGNWDEESFVVMQCTGLKDVEGNLIYEGDVIVIPNEYPFYDENVLNYVGVVEYIYNSWQYVYHCVNPLKNGISEGINYLLNEDGIEENENSYFKVIGNIYQNPEFLR